MAPVSDDDSHDDSAIVSRRSPVGFSARFTPGNDYYLTEPAPVSPSLVSIEPLPVQVPQARIVPSLDQYSMMNQANMIPRNTLQMSFPQTPFNFAAVFNNSKLNADQVLDDAVDELFNDANNFVELDEGADASGMWDTAEFGQESREDDLHLGFLLDKLLEN